MDWLTQSAARHREWLAQQAWLEGLQSSIATTPGWALLAAGTSVIALLTLTLRFIRSRLLTSHASTGSKAPLSETSPQAEAPQRHSGAVQSVPAPTAMGDGENDARSVRVFVSSTFLDMQSERNELVTKTFPALRAKYRARGVEVFEVDLRWGITRAQQERGETLPTLLAEIDRCRPYFIGLLGDRYGWVPPAAALTDKLKAAYPVLADAQGASVTAMEILHGVLSNPDSTARACFFERDPNWDWRATLNDADRTSAGEEPDVVRAKLEDLKTQVRRKASIESYARPEEIGVKVAAALDALLEARFPETEAPDAFEQTARLHQAYARERRVLHVGAEGYFDDLNRWMDKKEAAPLLITGTSGGGKSTLVANWLYAWRKAHPSDIVFEHYLGASPESAEPMRIMQRLWEHLNRVTGEMVALPGDNAGLMDVSAALAQRLAQARLSAERGGARVLIALDGLDKLSSEQNLRWLPIAPGLHWLASSLPGDAQTAALASRFAPLDVKPLSEHERRDFIAGTLARWRRELEPQQIARIMQPAATELAGSPLYLKTVLEELRVSADNARLTERLEDYRGARDMANLFDHVLKRLEDDCEPGLVAKALRLIWASRAGLEETEILAISGASPLAWAMLRNGLGDGLRDNQGRLAFGHDFLSQAVAGRYLGSDDQKRLAHVALADHFEAREPDVRQAEELPYQLHAAGAWNRLEALLVDLGRFALLRARGDLELWSHWLSLKCNGRDPERLLCAALEQQADKPNEWSAARITLAQSIAEFLTFAGAGGAAFLELRRCLVTAHRVHFGSTGRATLSARSELAQSMRTAGDYRGSAKLHREVLRVRRKTFGPKDKDTLTSMSEVALSYQDMGQFRRAQSLQEAVVQGYDSVLGREHPFTLISKNNLAETMRARKKSKHAVKLHEYILAARKTVLGPEHPHTLVSVNNLSRTLQDVGECVVAKQLLLGALDVTRRELGDSHPYTLNAVSNLGLLQFRTKDFRAAEATFWEVLIMRAQLFGDEHPLTLESFSDLALTLVELDELEAAKRMTELLPDRSTPVSRSVFLNGLLAVRGALDARRAQGGAPSGAENRVV